MESSRVTVGFGKKPKNIATNPNPDKLKELLARNGIPEKLIHLLKEILWFDSLNQEQVEKIIKRELDTLVNQPWVSGMNIIPTGELVKKLTTDYFEQPALSRNLKSFINKGLFEIRV
jgi:ATP-dependent Clp protease ATP-binding subunit ClpA